MNPDDYIVKYGEFAMPASRSLYQEIAKALRIARSLAANRPASAHCFATLCHVEDALIEALRADNPRFNERLFRQAAAIPATEKPHDAEK